MNGTRHGSAWRLLLGMSLIGLAGCYQAPSGGTASANTAKKAQSTGHSHGAGPHKGALAEWGEEEFHVEFKVDHEKQEATVYILDGTAKKDMPIEAKSITLQLKKPVVKIDLVASPQKGDPEGTSSRFVGKDPALAKEMEFEGTITGMVEGKPYSGDFEEEPEKPKKDSK